MKYIFQKQKSHTEAGFTPSVNGDEAPRPCGVDDSNSSVSVYCLNALHTPTEKIRSARNVGVSFYTHTVARFFRREQIHGFSSPSTAGFTLVEMVVAVGLFSVVMLIATGALLSVVHANRKAHALQSVMNNLNIALDGMTRSIRMGSNYRCGGPTPSIPDCLSGGSSLYFEAYGGSTSNPADDWAYWYDAATKRLYKSEQGGAFGSTITAPEVSIESLTFYVAGTTRGDTTQPKVVVTVKGVAGASPRVQTTFSIQATAVQRLLDL